ncbi:hypothetical protein CDL12_20533 [Handroanthus impetiginosus]|uniref:NAC domain-containing protein n=1 Tax=Handroanthus impetiginosus TaxID=429701 RepID=A0A2G9GNN6_9LAMI|nr:hypothetical protein CDL12_20533 [Handroanthus impetiginosus]
MAADLNPTALLALGYPPGFRFEPTDLELIRDYLKKKINNEPLPLEGIHEVNLYQYNPETLAENYPKLGDNAWYFFTPREKRYKNGKRPSRAAGTGFWKATGANKPVLVEDRRTTIGWKNVLVFHEGGPQNGSKTNWIMHEFKVEQPQTSRNQRDADDMKLDDWVMCRIYKKDNRVGENNQRPAVASALVDNNNPSESIGVDTPEIANNDNPAQTSNFLEVDSNGNSNNNNNFEPMVINDNNATHVTTDNNINLGLIPNDTTSDIDDVGSLLAYFGNDIPHESTLQSVLPSQNVPEISSSQINSGFDSLEHPPEQPPNHLGPPFFDIQARGIQPGDFQVQDYYNNPAQTGPSNVGSWGTQTSQNPPQARHSNVGSWGTQNSHNPPQIRPSNLGSWGTQNSHNPPQTQNSQNPPQARHSNVGSLGTQNSHNPPQTGAFNFGFCGAQDFNNPRQIGPSNIGLWGTQDSSNPPQTEPSNVGREGSK